MRIRLFLNLGFAPLVRLPTADPIARPTASTSPITTAGTPLPQPLQHFDLVDERELSPLQELIEQFTAGRGSGGPAGGGCGGRAGTGPDVGMLG